MCNQDLTVLFVESQLRTRGGGKVKTLFDVDVSTESLCPPPTHTVTPHQNLLKPLRLHLLLVLRMGHVVIN